MLNQKNLRLLRGNRRRTEWFRFSLPFAGLALLFATAVLSHAETALKERLKGSAFKIAFERYVNDNWEVFVMNADGSDLVNLTNTPTEHEHYPQVSPDASTICFSVDDGE